MLFPFVEFPVPPKIARAAGVVVFEVIPVPTFKVEPENALNSDAGKNVDEPLVPFKKIVPFPTFAMKLVGVFGEAATAVPPLAVV